MPDIKLVERVQATLEKQFREQLDSITEEHYTALEHYERGLAILEVAKEMEIDGNLVYKLLKEVGYSPRRAGAPIKRKLTPPEILKRFNDGQGESVKSIAEAAEVGPERIRQILKRGGAKAPYV